MFEGFTHWQFYEKYNIVFEAHEIYNIVDSQKKYYIVYVSNKKQNIIIRSLTFGTYNERKHGIH